MGKPNPAKRIATDFDNDELFSLQESFKMKITLSGYIC